MSRRLLLALLFVPIALGGAISCKRKPEKASAGGGFAIQVVAIAAKQQSVSESVGLVGSITANEMVEVKSETDGTVKDIAFAEGQRVEKGQLLVALDESKFQAVLNEAEADFKLSRANYERSQQLLGEKLISQQEYDQAAARFSVGEATIELQRRILRDARVLAPFSGITGSRQVSPGQVISRNTTLTWLVDIDTVKAEVHVPERYLSQVIIGQKINFSVAAFPKEVFQGEVYFISPQLDANTRTALVKAKVANSTGKLRGGMFASLNLTLRLRDSALVIPEPALMSNGDQVSVFVVDAQGSAQLRPVQVGIRLAGQVEVIGGLAVGDMVVVEGLQKLAPGMPVKLAPASAAAPYTKS